jgi:putative component of toxin-antitoxin plasmid stabilization module
MSSIKRIVARFFKSAVGHQPVRDWLMNGLRKADRTIVGTDIAKVEFGWPVGMPVCKSVGGGLWEVRSTIKSGKVEARTYFALDGDQMILLNGHEGKTGQAVEISLARKRWKDYQKRKAAIRAEVKKAIRKGKGS